MFGVKFVLCYIPLSNSLLLLGHLWLQFCRCFSRQIHASFFIQEGFRWSRCRQDCYCLSNDAFLPTLALQCQQVQYSPWTIRNAWLYRPGHSVANDSSPTLTTSSLLVHNCLSVFTSCYFCRLPQYWFVDSLMNFSKLFEKTQLQ